MGYLPTSYYSVSPWVCPASGMPLVQHGSRPLLSIAMGRRYTLEGNCLSDSDWPVADVSAADGDEDDGWCGPVPQGSELTVRSICIKLSCERLCRTRSYYCFAVTCVLLTAHGAYLTVVSVCLSGTPRGSF